VAWIKRGDAYGGSVQNEAKKSKASPPLQSEGVDYFYGSVDMKVSAMCTFVHLQRPLLYAGRAAQSVGDPTAAIVDSSPFRPFALPSRVCLCLACVYFFYLSGRARRPSVRPRAPHSDNRFHWSINSRHSLCAGEKFLSTQHHGGWIKKRKTPVWVSVIWARLLWIWI